MTTTSPFIKSGICNLNPEQLDGFQMLQYEKEFTEVPNKALPDIFQNGYELIFNRLNIEYSAEESTLVVGSKNGVYNSLYYPNTYADGEGENAICVVKWGKSYIPLKSFLNAFPNPNVNIDPESKKARLEFTVTLTTEEKELTTNNGEIKYPYRKLLFPIKLFFDPKKEWLDGAIAREIILNEEGFVDAELAEHLKQKGTATLVTPMKNIITIPCEFLVNGYSSRQAPHGISYTMHCEVAQGQPPISLLNRDGDEIMISPGERIDIWGTGNANNTLNTLGDNSTLISPEMPATLRINGVRTLSNGKISVSNVLELNSEAKNKLQENNQNMIKLSW